jgi:FHS family Na+ dependent glucose MFS transporter 1
MSTSTQARESSPSRAKGKLAQTGGYYLAFIALGLVTASLGPTLSGLAGQVDVSLEEISILFTAGSLGYLMGSLLGGQAYDRAPGHAVMGSVLLLLALLMALVPFVPWLWLLFAVLLLRGVASSTVDVGGNTLLVWLHGREVSPFMNGLHFCFGVGAFVSPLVVAQALRLSGDISWAYWTLASLIAPTALWILRLPSPTAQSNHHDDEIRRNSPLMVVLVAIVLLLYVGAESSMGGWIYTYATATGLASDTQAAYLTSLFWGVFTAGRLLSIPLARRLSPHRMLTVDWLGCLISVGAMTFFGDVPLTLWMGTVGVGLSMASIFPIMISFAERRMPITGEITGWFFVGASLGGMTLPWLIGQLFESIGPRVTVSAILVDLALATVVFGALMMYAQVQDGQ